MHAPQPIAQHCALLSVIQQAFKLFHIGDAKEVESSLNHTSERTPRGFRRQDWLSLVGGSDTWFTHMVASWCHIVVLRWSHVCPIVSPSCSSELSRGLSVAALGLKTKQNKDDVCGCTILGGSWREGEGFTRIPLISESIVCGKLYPAHTRLSV